jgi:cell division protein ZapA
VSNVTLRIGGRAYTVACADGEESHVTALGQLIDDKVQQMGAAGQSEPRQLLFAALLLADELDEARNRRGSATAVPAPASAPAPAPAAPAVDRYADALEAIATRLENYAAALEG